MQLEAMGRTILLSVFMVCLVMSVLRMQLKYNAISISFAVCYAKNFGPKGIGFGGLTQVEKQE